MLRPGLLVLLALRLRVHHAFITHTRFLIVSSPRRGQVAYTRISSGGVRGGEMKVLIDGAHGLMHPQGLAVDEARQLLFVADPDARLVLAFGLRFRHGTLSVSAPVVCARDVEARWVAVNGVGTVFISDEQRNEILRMAPLSHKMVRWNSSASSTTDMTALNRSTLAPTVIYDGQTMQALSGPGGIATDGFHVYWANKHQGRAVGSIVKAPEAPTANPAGGVQVLAHNSDRSYGVCIAHSNIFFTQSTSQIYGVKKKRCCSAPDEVELVSNRLQTPRGCAFDGDGTVFVADKGANAVYAFAANMQALSGAFLTKAANVEDAFGVAVYTLKAGSRQPVLGGLAAVAIAAVLLPALRLEP
mmetsp:Transcript_23670/g.74419  ORF Transcript_23670/g.74419 Transcript_23670/m.74419 type:complete len:358 (+) Transcript_23670:219-1292(+)